MAEARHHTRDDLLEILAGVFRSRGFEGATLTELARASGLGKASLYHHFPGGKDEMGRALLRQAVARLNDRAFRRLHRLEPPAERLRAFVEGFGEYAERGERPCLLMVFANSAAKDQYGDEIRHQLEEWQYQLARVFVETGETEKRAARQARDLLASLYGAMAIAQMTGETKPFRQTIKRLEKSF